MRSETIQPERDGTRRTIAAARERDQFGIVMETYFTERLLNDADRLAHNEMAAERCEEEIHRALREPRVPEAPTDNGIPELDSLCEQYNDGEIDLCALVCRAWNKAIAQSEQGRATDGGRNPHYNGTFEDETEEQAQNRRLVATILDAIALLEQSAGPFDEACRILRAAAPQPDATEDET